MVTAVLSIIASLLKLAEMTLEKATPDQVQGFLDRHEKRMEFWEGLVAKFTKEEK